MESTDLPVVQVTPSIPPGQRHAERWNSTVCSSNTLRRQWMRHWEKRWWHRVYCCRKHNQEIVNKSGLKASRPGSRRRAEVGPVGVLKQWGMWGRSARYVRDCRHRRFLLKIDMRNAFNSLRRDSFLSVACVRTPGIYNLLWQAYSSAARLCFGEEVFASETSIQQGDPIGPALFALSVDEAARGFSLNSMCSIWTILPSESSQRGFTTI